MNLKDWESIIEALDLSQIPLAIGVGLLAWIVVSMLSLGFDRLGESFTERRFFFNRLALFSRFLIYFLTTVYLVGILLLNPQAKALVGALLLLALAFSFKDVLTSVTGGLLLLIDAPFRVGDRIAFGDHYGEVIRIGLRSVQITTLDDNLVTIPNSKFLNDPVSSANAGAPDCMVVTPYYIAAAEDFGEARRLIYEATVTSRYVYLEKPVVTLVSDEFHGERFVTVIRVKAYVFDVHYEKAFASDVTERVKRAFLAAGIRTPDQQYRDLELNRGRETPA